MKFIVLFVSLALMISGMVLGFLCRKQRTELAKTIPWYNIRFWWNPWNVPDIYTEKGVRMHGLSLSLLMSGIGLVIAVRGLPSIFE